MQHMLIVGLDNLGDARTKDKAQKWAQKWVLTNYLAYKDTGHMYEKVNCINFLKNVLNSLTYLFDCIFLVFCD